MSAAAEFDAWSAGQNYEHYMGRWSRGIAALFLDWLAPPAQADWLEVGCGTGALTEEILADADPRSIIATDRSADFVSYAEQLIDDSRVRFAIADALDLPGPDASTDIVTSALVLNFVEDRLAALAEMRRVLRPGGVLSFYVWDYPGGGMGIIDAFWTAAAEVDPDAAELRENARFPFCTKDRLNTLCEGAGIPNAEIAAIEMDAVFPDFESFWYPFTLGSGPAPSYCMSLPPDQRYHVKEHLAALVETGGPIVLPARAWAVRADKIGWRFPN
ncbi:Methyltransferase domain-containing protein [Jannaschia faecimaris]|uniref:Methyltransferase domain-containing protein n=1 Tax=Jannaschia faecimaris TaxID=1244108 RepID=A0A1H3RQG0_9RHOB|nr:class I SAM-dependent methyltransferase [Jannaschia faecimaris]SDZ27952.1 Methyltransferase domain-containing protein [Jannaschia faecimaris]